MLNLKKAKRCVLGAALLLGASVASIGAHAQVVTLPQGFTEWQIVVIDIALTSVISGVFDHNPSVCSGRCGEGQIIINVLSDHTGTDEYITGLDGHGFHSFKWGPSPLTSTGGVASGPGDIYYDGGNGYNAIDASYGSAGPFGAQVWAEYDNPPDYGDGTLIEFVATHYTYKETVYDENGKLISQISIVPELSIWAMMALGFAGLGFAGYRRAQVA